MLAATAAILPPAIATSRTALMLFRASMTWPPFSRRSYFCCAATCVIDDTTRQIPAAWSRCSRIASTPSIVVPLGRPLRREVFAHVERAAHRVALKRTGKPEAQRVAVTLRVRAGDLHGVAVDRPGEIASDEIALMRTVEAIPGLFEVQRVCRRARDVVDLHVPLAADVGRRRRRACGLGRTRRLRQRSVNLLGDDRLFTT